MSSIRGRGGIFISYRREETAANAGRLYDRLSGHFGEDSVFMDVDSVAYGVDFTSAIRDAVSRCDVLLALIGQDWLAIADSRGKRRLDNPDDWVRVEIETALQRDIRVVPVLVNGATLPQASDLPPSLRPLTRRQALALSHTGFQAEVTRLMAAVDDVLEARPGRTAEAPETPRRGHAGGQRTWTLEHAAGRLFSETFRLSAEGESHEIIVKDRFAVTSVTVDGKPAVRDLLLNREYPLDALSSILGCDVTISRNSSGVFKSSSLTLKIGDQVVSAVFQSAAG